MQIELFAPDVKIDVKHDKEADMPIMSSDSSEWSERYTLTYSISTRVEESVYTWCRERFRYHFEIVPHDSDTNRRWFLVGHEDDLALFRLSR